MADSRHAQERQDSPDKNSADTLDSGTEPSDTDDKANFFVGGGSPDRAHLPAGKRTGKRAQRTERIALTPPLLASAGLSGSSEKLAGDIKFDPKEGENLKPSPKNVKTDESPPQDSHEPFQSLLPRVQQIPAPNTQADDNSEGSTNREEQSAKTCPKRVELQEKPGATQAKQEQVERPAQQMMDIKSAPHAKDKPSQMKDQPVSKHTGQSPKTVASKEKVQGGKGGKKEVKGRGQGKKGEAKEEDDVVQTAQKALHMKMMKELKSLAEKVEDEEEEPARGAIRSQVVQDCCASLARGVVAVLRALFDVLYAVGMAVWYYVPLIFGLFLFALMMYGLERFLPPISPVTCPGYEDRLQVIFRATSVALFPLIIGWLFTHSLEVKILVSDYVQDLLLSVLNLAALATFVPTHCLHWTLIFLYASTVFRLLQWLFYCLGAPWLERCFTSALQVVTVTLTCYTFLTVTGQELGFMPKLTFKEMADVQTQTDDLGWMTPSLCTIFQRLFGGFPTGTAVNPYPEFFG